MQMSCSKALMHKIQLRLGLCPRPQFKSLQRSPDPQLDLRGLLLRAGNGREEKKGEGTQAGLSRSNPPLFLAE